MVQLDLSFTFNVELGPINRDPEASKLGAALVPVKAVIPSKSKVDGIVPFIFTSLITACCVEVVVNNE
tara:strand:- start:74 stop:277 length:204 start_codon:yes stop_codon:yes gene_type:complete